MSSTVGRLSAELRSWAATQDTAGQIELLDVTLARARYGGDEMVVTLYETQCAELEDLLRDDTDARVADGGIVKTCGSACHATC